MIRIPQWPQRKENSFSLREFREQAKPLTFRPFVAKKDLGFSEKHFSLRRIFRMGRYMVFPTKGGLAN